MVYSKNSRYHNRTQVVLSQVTQIIYIMKTNTILIGQISQLSLKGYGFIESEQEPNLFFSLRNVVSRNIYIGCYVTFIVIPSKRHEGKNEAVNVTRAYLSKDNCLVVNRPASHLHLSIDENLSTIISNITCDNRTFFSEQLDYDYPVGVSTCISVDESDEIIFAIRENRKGHTKFVKNRVPELTNSITVIIKKTGEFYTIITAFIGKAADTEPWDERATYSSLEFWTSHALIWGTEKIEPNLEVKECPWEKEVLKENVVTG